MQIQLLSKRTKKIMKTTLTFVPERIKTFRIGPVDQCTFGAGLSTLGDCAQIWSKIITIGQQQNLSFPLY